MKTLGKYKINLDDMLYEDDDFVILYKDTFARGNMQAFSDLLSIAIEGLGTDSSVLTWLEEEDRIRLKAQMLRTLQNKLNTI